MTHEDKVEAATRRLNTASVNVRKGMTKSNKGGAYEKEYAEAYGTLVNLGVRPKLKMRYRFR
jgi:hypothetical protein